MEFTKKLKKNLVIIIIQILEKDRVISSFLSPIERIKYSVKYSEYIIYILELSNV